ncbi:MAG TPA: hypothetical protein VGP72_16910 [Planctomycetota bacterium]|jgi:hypothetical protein
MTTPDTAASGSQGERLEQGAGPELGSFESPADYQFEEELRSRPPRVVPAELSKGRFGTKRRRAVWAAMAVGLLCLAFAQIPVIHYWALFLLPLDYLSWIGLACVAIGAVAFIQNRVARGPYRYVEDGIPIVARICELTLTPTLIMDGQPSTYRFAATIQYRDPRSGQIAIAQTMSEEFSSDAKDSLTTSFRVGDHVTAVYLEPDLAATLRLYGFLDLRPNLGLISRKQECPGGVLQLCAGIAGIFALFFILAWNVYAFSAYQPLAMPVSHSVIAFVIGAALLGGALLGFFAYSYLSARRELAKRNAEAQTTGEALLIEPAGRRFFGYHGKFMSAVILAGSLLLGGITFLCWTYSANALLDSSPPKYQPVTIDKMVQVTHSFLFREYKIEYRTADGEKHTLLSSPKYMVFLRRGPATAEVHRGRFGWPWVRIILPPLIIKDAEEQKL